MKKWLRRLFAVVKHRRVRQILLMAFLWWLWIVFVLIVVIDAYGHVDRAQPADVIIVLGAGLQPDNTPGPSLQRRAAHAAELWKNSYAPVIICSGGKPGQRPRSESDACTELLRADGIPSKAIVMEDQSRSTEENAFDSKIIMDAHGWQTAIIVSDKYHLFRANRLFRNAGIIAFTSPTPDDPTFPEYLSSLGREIIAFHWQLFKEAFNIPITYVQSI
jgi:uncharacterized SAM-binding protein YcdF (DUF218 family)